ncbi:hypothetical protein Tco_1018799 [Tanacetum coccineum]|uniref:Uncharacterized protein n=1 Tax=Tanacetum coccineum TaxID=301880 RepID=A0ABQ5FVV4_9ASTR
MLTTTNGDYQSGMKVPDAMISDAIKKKVGYKYYIAKKVENEKAKIVDEPEEQHVSPIKSGRGKGFMWYGDQVANVPNKLKKDDVPRKTRPLTIAKEAVVEENAKETDDADKSDMDLPDDNPHGDELMEVKKIPYPITYPQPSSLKAKVKKLMQNAKKYEEVRLQEGSHKKFKEYDQKLEALTNFNMSEAFEKAVQEKVLTEIKKLLPTYIPNVIANYVKPRP